MWSWVFFTWEETADAFEKAFSEIQGLSVDESEISDLNRVSYGHPYLMQLLGYHLILQVNEHKPEKSHKVTESETDEAIANSIFAYEQRSLKPLVDELSNNVKEYLTKMAECLGEDRLAETACIARCFGTSQNKLSKTRAYLIDNGIIAAPEYGKVMFCIPYLADYVKKDEHVSDPVEVARQRRV